MKINISQQKGVVLIVSLIFLAILTILGTAGLQSTITAEKLALNTEDMNIALQAAEASIARAENWIRDIRVQTNSPPPVVCDFALGGGCNITQDIYVTGGIPETELNNPNSTLWNNNSLYAEDTWVGTNNTEVSQAPRYVIEMFSQQPYDLGIDSVAEGTTIVFYRITALAFGALPTTNVILQAIISETY